MKWFLGFLCENGVMSFARVVGFILVVYYMVLGSAISIATREFVDMPFGLLSLVLLAYGINKLTEFANFRKNGNGTTPLVK